MSMGESLAGLSRSRSRSHAALSRDRRATGRSSQQLLAAVPLAIPRIPRVTTQRYSDVLVGTQRHTESGAPLSGVQFRSAPKAKVGVRAPQRPRVNVHVAGADEGWLVAADRRTGPARPKRARALSVLSSIESCMANSMPGRPGIGATHPVHL